MQGRRKGQGPPEVRQAGPNKQCTCHEVAGQQVHQQAAGGGGLQAGGGAVGVRVEAHRGEAVERGDEAALLPRHHEGAVAQQVAALGLKVQRVGAVEVLGARQVHRLRGKAGVCRASGDAIRAGWAGVSGSISSAGTCSTCTQHACRTAAVCPAPPALCAALAAGTEAHQHQQQLHPPQDTHRYVAASPRRHQAVGARAAAAAAAGVEAGGLAAEDGIPPPARCRCRGFGGGQRAAAGGQHLALKGLASHRGHVTAGRCCVQHRLHRLPQLRRRRVAWPWMQGAALSLV